MKSKQYEEVGKGFIAFGNLVGGLSIVNTFFGNNNYNMTNTAIIIIYIFIVSYTAGIILIGKVKE
jgi:hypothetical protein